MSKKRNITGQKFGHLQVIRPDGQDKNRHYMSLVRCDCGKEYSVPDTELIYHRRTACRKCAQATHGMSKDRLFYIWMSMRARCNNKNKVGYRYYGGRGIKVCSDWNNSFEKFMEWALSNGYEETLSIDRIDVNKGYCPSNCRWIPIDEQARNKRNNVFFNYQEKRLVASELSPILGIKEGTLRYRKRMGWSDEEIIATKLKEKRHG